MAVQIQTRRSSTANDRPFPTRLGAGELALNNHSTSPGLFFADNVASPSTGLIKVGPVHIGSTAPNSSAVGFTSSSKGETWLDTASTHIFKVFDGSSFQSVKAVAISFFWATSKSRLMDNYTGIHPVEVMEY